MGSLLVIVGDHHQRRVGEKEMRGEGGDASDMGELGFFRTLYRERVRLGFVWI